MLLAMLSVYINRCLKSTRWRKTLLSNLDVLNEENEHLLCSSLCAKKYKDAQKLDVTLKENFLYSDTMKSGIKIVW